LNSRQVPSNIANTILYLIWFVIGVCILVWFYSAIKRIEKSLKEIEKKLESQTEKGTSQTGSTA